MTPGSNRGSLGKPGSNEYALGIERQSQRFLRYVMSILPREIAAIHEHSGQEGIRKSLFKNYEYSTGKAWEDLFETGRLHMAAPIVSLGGFEIANCNVRSKSGSLSRGLLQFPVCDGTLLALAVDNFGALSTVVSNMITHKRLS